MRENRTYGSEGGESVMVAPLPLSRRNIRVVENKSNVESGLKTP
jgi:hypothetical protein